MAWSEGNKRWTVPFVSLNGTTCRVDIYKRGYTGSDVITLSPNVTNYIGCAAENPFEYSEGDGDDLLNDVIRYRTGYLRLIESSYGSLDEIYPSANTDRYVEFYYGSTLDFTGFIQAQAFGRAWESGPREIDLPVISPIGLASGVKLDYTAFNPPSWESIHTIIRIVLGTLSASYSGYYFPAFMDTDASAVKNLSINTLTVCPFAKSFNKMNPSGDLTGIYEPKTVEEALRLICTGFGLILHDDPATPVFQRVDFQGSYLHLTFPTASSIQAQSVTDLTAIASSASDNNQESAVMPLSQVEVTYGGEDNIPDMSFERCRGAKGGVSAQIPDKEFCTNAPVISDFTGTYNTGNQTIDADGLILAGQKILGAYGSSAGSLREMILFRPNVANDEKVATYNFFEWNGESARLQFRFQFGNSIEQMNNPRGTIIAVRVAIKEGSTTLASKTWNSNANNEIPADCEVGFSGGNSTNPSPLTVEFYVTYAATDIMTAISDVRLLYYDSSSNAYLKKNVNPNQYTIAGSPSDVDGSISRGCWIYARTLNRIRANTSIPGTTWNKLVDSEPSYPHLLTVQDRLKVDLKMPYPSPTVIYLNRFTLWGHSGKWRIIAHGFRPWDDVHPLTLHHSTVFDY